jgi:hypothetical protein
MIDIRRFGQISAIVVALLGSVINGPISAKAQNATEAQVAGLRQQILTCFSPPPQASGSALLAVDLAADGTLRSDPDVVSQDTNEAFVVAARRAIQRCAPYRTGLIGKIIIRFGSAPPEASEPDAAGAAGSEPSPPPASVPLPYPAPQGFCFVIPTRSKHESLLWNAFQPPRGRREILETLAVDCPSLSRSADGAAPRPVAAAMVARTEEPPGLSEPLEAFLARLGKRFEAEEALTPRFWQAPPIAGSPIVGRDAEAVYTANRQLGAEGRIKLTVLAGYTRIDGATRTFSLARFDGSDITPRSHEQIAAWIGAARRASQQSGPASPPSRSR